MITHRIKQKDDEFEGSGRQEYESSESPLKIHKGTVLQTSRFTGNNPTFAAGNAIEAED